MNVPDLAARVLTWAAELQQIPGPTFHEARRAAWLAAQWQRLGLPTETDALGNVYARLPGTAAEGPVVVTAHLDTVFPLDTPLTLRREPDRWCGPGIGDNSLGVAGLLGLTVALRDGPRLPGPVVLVGNVREEGLGNLDGMRAVVARFGAAARAYIVVEDMALERVYHRGLWIARYRVTVHTPGGHSWAAYGTPSAVHELAALVAEAAGWRLPRRPRVTFNVGVFHGGTSVNTIAAQAYAEVDWRAEEQAALHRWTQRFVALAQARQRPGVTVQVESIGQRPGGSLPVEHPLVQAALAAYRAQGVDAQPGIGSTDANVPLSQGLPAVVVGLTRGWGAHTLGECIETSPVTRGLAGLVALVRRVAQGEGA